MKNRHLILVLMISFFLPVSLLTAQDKPAAKAPEVKPMPQRGGLMQGRMNMMNGLKLSDEQKQKIQQLKLDMEKEIIKINSQLELNKVDLKKLFTEKQLNTGKFSSLTEENGMLELKVKKLRTDNWIKIYNLLDDDQKEIWKKQIERQGILKQAVQRRMAGRGTMAGMRPGRMMQNMGPGMRNERMQRQMKQTLPHNVEKDQTIEKK